MLVERTRNASFGEAVRTTFDGAHPCKLCKKVETGRKKEKQPEPSPTVAKLVIFYEVIACKLFPPKVKHPLGFEPIIALVRPHTPPIPPPRGC